MKKNNPNITYKLKDKPKEGTVHSSYGEIAIDLTTGEIIDVFTEDPIWEDWARTISRFDLEEYRKFYDDQGEQETEFDILDVGHWEKNTFHPPAANFREQIKKDNTTLKILRRSKGKNDGLLR